MINVYDKWFVGIRASLEEGEPYPLAFVTQDTGNADFAKREETVRDWAKKTGYKETVIADAPQFLSFDSVPTPGYSVAKSVSRSETDNKLFRMNDPRGFQFEIAAANLAYLLLNCTFEKGVIKEALIYAKNRGSIYLTLPDNTDIFAAEMAATVTKLDIGDMILYKKQKYVYLGVEDLVGFTYVESKRGRVSAGSFYETLHGDVDINSFPPYIIERMKLFQGVWAFYPKYFSSQVFKMVDCDESDAKYLYLLESKKYNLLSKNNDTSFDSSSETYIKHITSEWFTQTTLVKHFDFPNASDDEIKEKFSYYIQWQAGYGTGGLGYRDKDRFLVFFSSSSR